MEGIEGSGKSTLAAAVAERLAAEGRSVLLVREPGGTRIGDAVRDLFLDPEIRIGPMAELMLVNASRAELVAAVLRPALERGDIVICDRYADSTVAYQGYGRGLDLAFVRRVCEGATEGLMPERTFLLDLPVETAFGRLHSRGAPPDRLEAEHASFHERVRRGFLEIAQGEARFRVLDATLPPDRLVALVTDELRALAS